MIWNIEVFLEEGKISELTYKELAEDRVGLIIKSLLSLSVIFSSFLFRKFFLRLGVEGFIHVSKIYVGVLQQH